MTIDKSLVGFFGAVAAATAASAASRPVPASITVDPVAFFQHLVTLRGETEMRRHAERLALHVVGEVKSGRATLPQVETRVTTLTGLVMAFPPKTNQLEEALDRSRGRSAAAAALILASAVVSRAQARGLPDQARVDPSWATDLIAEGLAALISDPEFLAGVGRALDALGASEAAAPSIANEPRSLSKKLPAAPPKVPAVFPQLLEALRKHGVADNQFNAVLASKQSQLNELRQALAAMRSEHGEPPAAETMRIDARSALAAGDLALTAEILAALASRLADDGRNRPAAEVLAAQGLLEELRLEHQAAALHYGDAYQIAPAAEPVVRWGFALRQGSALASEADDLNRTGEPCEGPLAEAARVYAAALLLMPAAGAPELASVTQNYLGNTLLRLGEIEGKAELFEHAAKAYQAAATGMDRLRSARDWALVHSNLGTALLKAGELGHAERNYEDAAAAFDKALEVLRPDTASDWAAAEAGRGMAQGRLGAIRSDLAMLERTARSVDAALAQLNRRDAAGQWARLQSCLGNICADLGERIGGRHWLERAVTAYEAAQEEWSESASPLQWALSEANRGGVFLGLGTLTSSRRHLELAEESLIRSDRVFTRLGEHDYAAAARQSLKAVRTELGNAPMSVHPNPPPNQPARARL